MLDDFIWIVHHIVEFFILQVVRRCNIGYHYQFCTILFSMDLYTAPPRPRVELLAKRMHMHIALATANENYSSCNYSFNNLDLAYILSLVFTNIVASCINFYITIKLHIIIIIYTDTWKQPVFPRK